MKKILFSYFTLAALTALVQKIVNLLNAQLPKHQMVQTILMRFQSQLQTALQAIGSTIKQPLTEIVTTADKRRDNSYKSLRNHIYLLIPVGDSRELLMFYNKLSR